VLSIRRSSLPGSVERSAVPVRRLAAGSRAARCFRGYLLHQVAQFIDSLRKTGGTDALTAFLDSWQNRLTTRSRNLLSGAAQLDTYLTMLDHPQHGWPAR